jgi:anti-sigma factor RsiW
MKRTCRISRYLEAYVDNELSPRLRAKVERHLQRCTACAAELDSIRASDRILRAARPPVVSEARWRSFDLELSRALDAVDAVASRPSRIRETRPIEGTNGRWALATATVAAAAVLAILVIGPAGLFRGRAADGNECIVDSIESYTAGYTPMFFTSDDPEMTVIWVFADETGPGPGANGIGTR